MWLGCDRVITMCKIDRYISQIDRQILIDRDRKIDIDRHRQEDRQIGRQTQINKKIDRYQYAQNDRIITI